MDLAKPITKVYILIYGFHPLISLFRNFLSKQLFSVDAKPIAKFLVPHSQTISHLTPKVQVLIQLAANEAISFSPYLGCLPPSRHLQSLCLILMNVGQSGR